MIVPITEVHNIAVSREYWKWVGGSVCVMCATCCDRSHSHSSDTLGDSFTTLHYQTFNVSHMILITKFSLILLHTGLLCFPNNLFPSLESIPSKGHVRIWKTNSLFSIRFLFLFLETYEEMKSRVLLYIPFFCFAPHLITAHLDDLHLDLGVRNIICLSVDKAWFDPYPTF